MTVGRVRRPARGGRRLWVPEVPEAFRVPEVAAAASVAEPVASAPAGEVSGETVSGRSKDGAVELSVDLDGILRRLRIEPGVLRGPHPARVGAAVVEALADARARALVRLRKERRR